MARVSADLIAAAALIALGIFITFQAAKLDYSSEYGPGPGFLPLWLGIGFIVLAAPLLIAGIRSAAAARGLWKGGSWQGAERALIAWCALAVAVALLKKIGFVTSFALLTIFLIWAVERRSPLTAVAVALAGALAFYLVFPVALGLPLPTGFLGF